MKLKNTQTMTSKGERQSSKITTKPTVWWTLRQIAFKIGFRTQYEAECETMNECPLSEPTFPGQYHTGDYLLEPCQIITPKEVRMMRFKFISRQAVKAAFQCWTAGDTHAAQRLTQIAKRNQYTAAFYTV